MIKPGSLATCCAALFCAAALHAQTPVITGVTGEANNNELCPGGVGFIQGTNLGSKSATVLIGDKPAYVLNSFNNGTTLQIQAPVNVAVGPTTVTVGSSAPFNITLAQYSPALPVSPPSTLVTAYHANGALVTAGYPASPNEQITLLASGLGPTNPVYAAGTAPADDSAVVLVLPSVTIGGKQAAVSTAYLAPRPGFYMIALTVPASLTTGTINVTVSIGGINSNTETIPVATGPIVGTVTSAATYIDPALPNGAIAQGAIFVAKGVNMGPAQLAIDPKPFQNTTTSGTAVSITVGSTTVQALMYYTSAAQIAGLVPSNTPVGTGTMTVSYNGQPGPAHPITVTENNLGIFTATSDGQGAGIVTYPDYSLVSPAKAANCGGVYTTCGAANPGDVLIIWATGLGPVNGSDAAGAGLGVNMTSVPLTIWLGGVAVQASYQGRSGCCIGEDQIIFTVPNNVPTGCAVPLSVQIGNFVSNGVSMPVAPTGSRTCVPSSGTVPPGLVTAISSGSGPFTYGEIDMKHSDQDPGFIDKFNATFVNFTIASNVQPFFLTYADDPAPGTCQMYNQLAGNPGPPLTPVALLDAGPQMTVQGPSGSVSIPSSPNGYNGKLSATGNFLKPGTFTVSAPGGKDIGAFSGSITYPAFPTLTSPTPDAPDPIPVTRVNGLTVSWTGGQGQGNVQVELANSTDNTNTIGADVLCSVPASAGSFTIPGTVLQILPPGSLGGLVFRSFAVPTQLTIPGLDVAFIKAWSGVFTPINFK